MRLQRAVFFDRPVRSIKARIRIRSLDVQKDNDREQEPRGVAGRAAVAYLKEGQAMMKIVLIYMLGFLAVVAIVLFL